MENELLRGLSPDGWIYEGFQYPGNFTAKRRKFQLCSDSHPEKLTICETHPLSKEKLQACTFYEPEKEPDHNDRPTACAHCLPSEIRDVGLCQKHLDIKKYLEEYMPAPWNDMQMQALKHYENGAFSHLTCEDQLQRAGDEVILFVVRQLAGTKGTKTDQNQEAYRRMHEARQKIGKLEDLFDDYLAPF